MAETYIRKAKNLVKKILGMNYNLIRSDFDEENSCKALEELLEIKPELLNERSMAGERRDKEDFYPSARKIADAFDFYRVYLHKYDEMYPDVPEIGEYDGLHSGTPIKWKPYKGCTRAVKRMLKRKNLSWYPSTGGSMYAR